MNPIEENIRNPNTATAEQLTSLPGVGPKLAAKMIAARPFATLDDLLTIPGVSANLLDKLRPHLSLADRDDDQYADDESVEVGGGEAAVDVAATPEDDPAEPSEIILIDPQRRPRGDSRRQHLWVAVVAAGVSFALSLIVVFAVLASINDGLRYANPTEVGALRNEVTALQSQADAISNDIASLRTRVDNLDVLGGRVTALEDTATTIEADVSALTDDIIAFDEQINTLNEDVETLQTESSKYQDFINALQALLSEFTD